MENNSSDKVTLTQRKAASSGSSLKRTAGSTKLKRSKIKDLKDISDGSGSAGKIVIWVVIVVALASAAYLGLKSYLNSSDSTDDDTTVVEATTVPTPTPNPLAELFSDRIFPDDTATNLQQTDSFSTDKQTVGVASEDEFSIDKLFIQQYASFIRLEFTVSSEGEEIFPETLAEYLTDTNEIQIALNNVTTDESGLDFDETITLTGSVALNVTHQLVPDIQEVYTVELEEETGFVLHTIEGIADNMIVLDILEPGSDIVEPDETGEVEVSPTPTQANNDSSQSENSSTDFSKGTQSLVVDGTGSENNVSISKYNYFDGPSFFTYRLFVNNFPPVTAGLAENQLTVEVSKIASDGIVGNGGSGSTNFSGAVNLNKVDISNSNNKSTYVFDLDKETEYRMFYDEADGTLTIEIKHN